MNHPLVLKVGDFLFRWRGYFPLVLLIPGWKALFLPECVFLSLSGIKVRFIMAGYTP